MHHRNRLSNRRIKTEHVGPKNLDRKSGFYGPRAEAKEVTKRLRRRRERTYLRQQQYTP